MNPLLWLETAKSFNQYWQTQQTENELEHSLIEQNHQLTESNDIYRLYYPTTAEYKLFSSSLKTFSKIDHIVDHKIYWTHLKNRSHTKYTYITMKLTSK